ncbi:MAG: hypothetical protein M3O31_06215 [Acidobacteriota bacterium]|nr:hypothetical protein [Acidobacteriota bacterium]
MAMGIAPAIAGAHALQAQVVAHVLDVRGQWRLDGNTAQVISGQGLTAGAKITSSFNRPGDSITIVHDEDMSRQWVACDDSAANPCHSPIVVPGASVGAAPNQLRGLVNAALSVLLSKPPAIGNHYALTLTRGIKPKVQEMEAVVPLDPALGIVLPTVSDDLPAGKYSGSIAPAGEKASSSPQTVQLTPGGTWSALRCDAPGLYEVSISNAGGHQVADVMLLVTTAAQFPAARDEFKSMKNRTSKWDGPKARSDEHLFLRAYLLQASQAGTSSQ